MPGGRRKALAPSALQVATRPTDRLNMMCGNERNELGDVIGEEKCEVLWTRSPRGDV